MIQYERITHEQALRKAFQDQPSLISQVANSYDDDQVSVTLSLNFHLKAKYAKAVLKDVLAEMGEQLEGAK